MNTHVVQIILRRAKTAHTIIGDMNDCGGSKKTILQESIEEDDWQNIGREDHTHRWGNHQRRIERVITSGGRAWYIEEGWECGRDHTIVAAKVEIQAKVIKRKEINWGGVREREEGTEGERREWAEMGRHTGS